MKSNPMIEVPATRFEIGVHIVSYSLLVAMFLFVSLNYSSLPEQIPGHYSFDGEITRMMSKAGIWIFPFIATIILLVFSFLCKVPYMSSYPVKVTEENARAVYREGRMMLATLGLYMVIFMFLILWQFVNDAPYEQMTSKTPWLSNVLIAGLLIHIVYYTYRIRRHKVSK